MMFGLGIGLGLWRGRPSGPRVTIAGLPFQFGLSTWEAQASVPGETVTAWAIQSSVGASVSSSGMITIPQRSFTGTAADAATLAVTATLNGGGSATGQIVVTVMPVSALYTNPEQDGMFIATNDAGSMFGNRNGTGANTADGGPVGLAIDRRRLSGATVAEYMAANSITDPLLIPGNHAVAPDDASRPTLNGLVLSGGVLNITGPTGGFAGYILDMASGWAVHEIQIAEGAQYDILGGRSVSGVIMRDGQFSATEAANLLNVINANPLPADISGMFSDGLYTSAYLLNVSNVTNAANAWDNNALDEAGVDYILSSFAANTNFAGPLGLAGGTNAAPSLRGGLDKLTIEQRGSTATVTTNGDGIFRSGDVGAVWNIGDGRTLINQRGQVAQVGDPVMLVLDQRLELPTPDTTSVQYEALSGTLPTSPAGSYIIARAPDSSQYYRLIVGGIGGDFDHKVFHITFDVNDDATYSFYQIAVASLFHSGFFMPETLSGPQSVSFIGMGRNWLGGTIDIVQLNPNSSAVVSNVAVSHIPGLHSYAETVASAGILQADGSISGGTYVANLPAGTYNAIRNIGDSVVIDPITLTGTRPDVSQYIQGPSLTIFRDRALTAAEQAALNSLANAPP